MFSKLTSFLDEFIDMGIPGFDCIVYHNGECVYRHMNGYSDNVNKIKVTGKEKYNIYSCSKPITCTAALQLYEKGLFSLEDKLSKYMPEFETMYVKTDDGIKEAKSAITIKDLFCMTAGFSYNLNSPMLLKAREETNGKCPTRKIMEYLSKEPLLFEPGARFEYSLCHDVLAALVEVISGEEFSAYVQKNIFKPLGMKNSTFLLPDSELDRVSTQYVFDNDENVTKVRSKQIDYKLGTEYASGGAGCVSTVEDYIKFLEALRIGNVILKDETIELMSKNKLTDEQLKSYWVEGYGYGLGVRCPKGDGITSDFGWGGAAGSYLVIDRKNNITAFYAQHVLNSPNQGMRSGITPIIKEILCKAE